MHSFAPRRLAVRLDCYGGREQRHVVVVLLMREDESTWRFSFLVVYVQCTIRNHKHSLLKLQTSNLCYQSSSMVPNNNSTILGITFIIILSVSCSTTIKAFSGHNINCHNKPRLETTTTSLDVEPPDVLVLGAGTIVTVGALAWWLGGSKSRNRQAKYDEWKSKEREYQEERERLAYIGPREVWKEEDLKAYDGSADNNTGPLLMAVKGDVFNVWKGRNFYGPGAEYHIMAGRDATRFLAKNRLEEETEEEKRVELNVAERANLEAWYWTIKNKYQRVGSLQGYEDQM